MYYVEGTGEVHKRFWLGNLRERSHLEDVGVDGRIKLIWIIRKCVGRHGLD